MIKKRKKMDRNFFLVFLSFFFVVIVFFLSIGWSTFSQNLLVDHIGVTVRAQSDIRITDFSVSNDGVSQTNGAISMWEEFNVNKIESSVYLPNDTSKIKYKIEITNFGNVDMGIFDITGLSSELEIESIENYTVGQKLCNNDKCNLGMKKDIYITIGYKNGVKPSSKEDYIVHLDFDFRKIYKVTYVDLYGNLPNEIIEGGTLTATFNQAPYDIIVYQNNVEIRNYTLNQNVFTLQDVRGDISVSLAPFLFDVKSNKSELDITEGSGSVTLTLTNYNSDRYNHFDINYEVSVEANSKFNFNYRGDAQKGVLSNGRSTKQVIIDVTPVDDSNVKLLDNFIITIKTTSPVESTKQISISVKRTFMYVGNVDGTYSSEIDCTHVPNYKNLTADNFLFNVEEINIPEPAHGTLTFTKTYNPNTGKLTVARNSITGHGTISFKGQIYATTEAKELTTKSGDYVVQFDCTHVEHYYDKTENSFIIDMIKLEIPTSTAAPDGAYGRLQFTKVYDPVSGVLTVTRSSITGTGIIIHPYYTVYAP